MSDRPLVPSSLPPASSGSAPAGRPAVLGAALLLVAVLGAAAPLVGVLSTADGSPVRAAAAAGWVAVLPGLLVLGLAPRRPAVALAAAAGAGLLAVTRLVADLPLITGPDDLVRPELFAETTDRARPFTAGVGAWLVVLADLLAVVVGVLAARALAALPMPERADRAVTPGANGPSADHTIPPALPAPARSVGPATRFGAGTDGGGFDGGGFDTGGSERGGLDGGGFGGADAPAPLRLAGNAPMIAVGCLGTVLVAAGSLSVPYIGGYLDLRLVPAAADLSGVLAAVVLLLALAVTVLVAAGLPRAWSAGLLGGAGLVAALPGLIAVVAVATGAPTDLAAAAFVTVVGGASVAASAALNRIRPTPDGSESTGIGGGQVENRTDRDDRADREGGGGPAGSVIVGVLLLAAAGACLLAWRWPIPLFDGAAPTPDVAEVAAPAGPPFLAAALVLAVAGVLCVIPRTAAAGRAAAGVVWAGALLALTDAAVVLSRLTTAASNTRDPLNALMAAVPAEYKHTWSAGSGLWAGVVGVVLAAAGAVAAPVMTRRVAERSLLAPDEATAERSRSARRVPMVVLILLVVVAGTLPVWTADLTRSSSLLRGYELGTLGVWAVTIVAVGAVATGGWTLRPAVAAAAPVAAAVVLAQRCLVPAALRSQDGFAWAPGLVVGVITVVALLAAAPVCWHLTRRVRLVDVGRPGRLTPPLTAR